MVSESILVIGKLLRSSLVIDLSEVLEEGTPITDLKEREEPLKIEVDNRQLNRNSLFVAIKGERFNPLDHLDSVKASGCQYVLFERGSTSSDNIEKYCDDILFIEVDSIEDSIANLGRKVADRFKVSGGKILAISGSNGKTTTKEMTYFLSSKLLGEAKVICTQKNNNNHLGVPFTLFQITNETKFAIVELGSNSPGEIEFLCKITQPQFGVVTNIGDTHLEFFGSREAVFEEESVLADYCLKTFFSNQDDKFLRERESSANVLSFGQTGVDYKFSFHQNSAKLNEFEIINDSITGDHNFTNMCLSAAMVNHIFETDLKILAKWASEFKPTSNRSEWIDWKGMRVFLDAYNANPSSMKLALQGFFKKIAPIEPKDVCVVLGDMNELGDSADAMHKEVGEFVSGYKVYKYIFVGRYAEQYVLGCGGDNAIAAVNTEEATRVIARLQESVKYLFIKGSRSLQLERILDIK